MINTKQDLFNAFEELGATNLKQYDALFDTLEQFCRSNGWSVKMVDEYLSVLREREVASDELQLNSLIEAKYAEYGAIELSEYGYVYFKEHWDDATNSADGGRWTAVITEKTVTSAKKGDLGGDFISKLYQTILNSLSPVKQSEFWESTILENTFSLQEKVKKKDGTLLSKYTLKKKYYQYLS